MKLSWSTRLVGGLGLLALLLNLGCGGAGNQNTTAAESTQSQPGPMNSYVGTQGTDPATGDSGAVWQLTINHSTNSFSSADYASQLVTANGLFTFDGGFLDFSQTSTSGSGNVYQPDGFALEVPGRVAFFRPGFNGFDQNGNPTFASSPVVSVPSGCVDLYDQTFQFVTLPTTKWAVNTDPAYGSIQVSTSGSTWNLSGVTQFTLAQSRAQGVPLAPGTCAQAAVGTVVSVPPTPPITDAYMIVVGPSGFFIMNEGRDNPGAIGLLQPSTALDAPKIAASNYLAFISEPALPPPSTANQVGFFGCPSSGCAASSLVGGAFPNDDPTTAAATNITIDLGPQNPNNNGLFDSALLTIPDPVGSPGACVSPGVPGSDPQGNPTCTVPAVAVAGNPENKFAIFLLAQDMVNSVNGGPMPLAIYLLQE